MGVRRGPSLSVAIVTHFVTRPFAFLERLLSAHAFQVCARIGVAKESATERCPFCHDVHRTS